MSLITVQIGGAVVQMLPDSPQPDPALSTQRVTMKQARLALLQANRLAQVEAVIASLSEPDKSRALIEWEYSATIERDNPVLLQIAAAIAMPDQEIDDLFTVARQIA
jgi:hypothetical protein